MILNDWPGRGRAEASRQWPALERLAHAAASIEGIDGLILIGSFANGEHDEVSDVDVLAVVAPGRFHAVWNRCGALTSDALVSWASGPKPDAGIGWLKWLTRDLVKLECGIVDPSRGGRGLADPYVVLVGEPAMARRFPPVSRAEVEARRREQADQPIPDDPNALPYGELIDWKLSELKNAVRRGLRGRDS